MANRGKIQEGEKHLAEAQKCLKTNWMKWSPDLDGAASHFEKAALCFRNARAHGKACDAYQSAADTHYKNSSIFHSGKFLEQASNVARDDKKIVEAARLMKLAGDHYLESGHPDTSGQVYLKAAKLLQHDNPGLASKYFVDTAEFFVSEERPRDAGNAMKDAVRMLCRVCPRKFNEIEETAHKSMNTLLQTQMINVTHEMAVVQIVAILHEGRTLDARETLSDLGSVPEFGNSEEVDLLEKMVDAYSQQDEEALKECTSDGIFRALDPEFVRLINDLTIHEAQPSHPKPKPNKSASGTSGERLPSVMVGPKVVGKPRMEEASTLSEMRGELFKTIGSSSKGNKPKTRVPDSPSPPPPPPPSLETHSTALSSEEERSKLEEEVRVEHIKREEEAVNDDSGSDSNADIN